MSLPKEPRQKMINLMYLVLTAMLALNVSAEILNAFKTVDTSLHTTNTTVNASTNTIMASLAEKRAEPGGTGEKAKIWYTKAEEAQRLSKDMYDYIEGLRSRIHKEAGFDPAKNGDSTFKQDNLDIATRIMVQEGEGKKLLAKLTDYKKNILAIDPMIAAEFANTLQVDLRVPVAQDKSNKSWEAVYFSMVPTVAAMTILRKFQNDVKTSENRVIAFAHEQIGKVEVKFDAFEAIVGQNSKYLMPGQELEISAGLGAFSKTKLPDVFIGGSKVSLNDKGMAIFKTAAGSVGNHTIPVVVKFKDQDGNDQSRSFNVEYTVGQANASIALDKMNVLYIGVDNPVSIAASGGSEQIQASISGGGGSISGSNGKYIVRVNTPTDDCKISVSVQGKLAGTSQFRVRTIPTPVATIGGFAAGDNINAGAFRAQGGVGAYIKDFPFDLKYTVTSYVLSTDNEDGDIVEANVSGNSWAGNGQAQNVLRQIKPGKTVYVDDIRAQGPDGRVRKLPSLVYYIK